MSATAPIIIDQKMPSAITSVPDPVAAKVLAYLTRVGQLSAQNAHDVQRLEAKLDHLIALLEEHASRPALAAPAGAPLIKDMARSIYRTSANGKLYWHVRTSRYAKHGVALWPDPETLAALGVTEQWLRSLPFEGETPFLKPVLIATTEDGKKPKIVGLA